MNVLKFAGMCMMCVFVVSYTYLKNHIDTTTPTISCQNYISMLQHLPTTPTKPRSHTSLVSSQICILMGNLVLKHATVDVRNVLGDILSHNYAQLGDVPMSTSLIMLKISEYM